MDVSLTNDTVTLEPDVPTELLVDVVNTADVIDIAQVDLTGAPGAVSTLEATPTLFPGERRRLPLKVRLPAQMTAGRHELAVRVRPTVTDTSREAGLTVDVGPKPAMSVGVQPSVRKTGRRTTFPLTIANRGNTPLLVQPRKVEVPDGVDVSFQPNEFTVQPWQTHESVIRVRGPRNLVGAVLEHPLDLHVTAYSSTPGQPLIQEELHRDLQLKYRQKAVFSTWLLFTIGLVLMLALWCVLGYFGVKTFVAGTATPLKLAPALSGHGRLDNEVPKDVSITIYGTVLSRADKRPQAGVTVLACDAEDPQARPRKVRIGGKQRLVRPLCERDAKTGVAAVEQDVSGADGTWWIENIPPGKYWLYFDSPTGPGLQTPAFWYTSSCSMVRQMPYSVGDYRLRVYSPGGFGGVVGDRVRVVADKVDEPDLAEPVVTPDGAPTPSATAQATIPVCTNETRVPGPRGSSQPTASPTDPADTDPAKGEEPPAPWKNTIKALEIDRPQVLPRVVAPVAFRPPADGNPEGQPEDVREPAADGTGGKGGGAQDSAEDQTTAGPDGAGASATLRLSGLKAPGRYDLTIQFGGRSMLVRDVQVLPGRSEAVTSYRFSPTAVELSAGG